VKQQNRRRSDTLVDSVNVAASHAVSIRAHIGAKPNSRPDASISITKQQLPLAETIR
jgi:hypothetical protein